MTDLRRAPRAHFDALHEARPDPWRVLDSWYEIRKRRLLLDSLPQERLGRVLEIGCSIGAVTEELAARADAVLALDVSAEAVRRARARLASVSRVEIREADIRDGVPPGTFDTVVVSEVGYYLDRSEWVDVLDDIELSLGDGGVVALCHWRAAEPDFRLTADEVHSLASERLSVGVVSSHTEADFRIDVLSRDERPVSARSDVR